MAQTHDTSPAVVGAIKMAGVLFNTEEPTKAHVRQIRHWIRTGALKVKRMNNILVATEASLREQVTP